MIRRLFWLAVGAGLGVWALRRAQSLQQALRPEAVAGTAAGTAQLTAQRVSGFLADVRELRAEREAELRDGLGLDGRHDAVDADAGTTGSVAVVPPRPGG